jgi:hypothetical protein
MTKIWKYSGILLAATGVLHTIVAIFIGWKSFVGMLNDGLLNSVGDDTQRSLALWFLVCGVMLILGGGMLHHYIRKAQLPPPRWFAWWMIVLSVLGCVLVPASGFWLFLPQAAIILLAKA